MVENPYAFPSPDDGRPADGYGMTLRDWFAGQIAPSLLIADTNDVFSVLGTVAAVQRHVATVAYGYADAMLAERAKASL